MTLHAVVDMIKSRTTFTCAQGMYEEREFALYVTHKKSLAKEASFNSDSDKAEMMEKETLTQFYRVEDMFDFDNVGFSKVEVLSFS